MDLNFDRTTHFSASHWCPAMALSYSVSSRYVNPPACLPGSVCGVLAAGGVPALLTVVFCGMADYIVGFSCLPFGVCSALLWALWQTSSH